MPRDLNAIPGAQIGEDLPPHLLDLLLHQGHFLLETDAQGMRLWMFLQLLEFAL